jgi:glycosyltransferase involved in cell wall biosynthesis
MIKHSVVHSSKPVWSDVGVIALVPDDWGPQWQPRHQVLSRLAAYFHIAWMNPPHRWRDCFSPNLGRKDAKDCTPTPAGFEVYRPEPWLPILGRPAWLAHFTSGQRLKRVAARLRACGCTKLVLYIWRPEFAGAIEEIQHDLSVYHIDDEYSFSSIEKEISPLERRLLESVGQVFIHSPALFRKKGGVNPNTEFVPNGVDYKLYATPVPEPEDLRNIPHPRIGYVGRIKNVMDWNLLLELSATHAQWSFVFVGPKAPHPEIDGVLEVMSRRPNVHFLGGKPTQGLGGYPQHFDVCTMPYVLDDYTKYIYPLKMHEYLASGKPVVSAPICSVQEFSHVVGIARNHEEWSSLIGYALAGEENAPARLTMRQQVALEHDWEVLVAKIAGTITHRLGLSPQQLSATAMGFDLAPSPAGSEALK